MEAKRTKLDGIKQKEKEIQTQLAKLEEVHKSKMAALAGMENPSQEGALGVATVEVQIKIMQGKLLDIQAAVKAEADRMESPEVKKAVKDAAKLEAEVAERRAEVAQLLIQAEQKVNWISGTLDKSLALRAEAGEEMNPYTLGYEETTLWTRQMINCLGTVRLYGGMNNPKAGAK